MRTLLFSCLFLLSGLTLMAQPAGEKDPAKRAQHLTDKMEQQLSLTAEQKPKVYQINLETAKKMIAIEDKYANLADKAGMGKERRAVEMEREQQLSTVLTADQLSKYREIRQQKMQERKQKRGQ